MTDADSVDTTIGATAPAAIALDRVHRLKKLAAGASVAVALLLIAAKAVAYLATGSVSLLSTLVDSLLDFAASLINLIAIRHAVLPADREHRFGHGKAEPLAGLGQAAFVAGSAIFVLVEAVARLVHPTPDRQRGYRHRRDGAVDRRDAGTGAAAALGDPARPARSRSAPTRCTTSRTCWSMSG